ncbi:MAG TPA: hypothetical protein VIV12_16095 [Streptosporangiaceae bacterium]
MAHTVLLNIHIAVGALGLLLGPLAIWPDTRELGSRQRPTGSLSVAYVWTVLAVSLSAIVLVIWYRAELWWLVPVAVFSCALAMLGRYAAARQFRGWSHAYVHGQGGSYIALVTALVVVALTVDGAHCRTGGPDPVGAPHDRRHAADRAVAPSPRPNARNPAGFRNPAGCVEQRGPGRAIIRRWPCPSSIS